MITNNNIIEIQNIIADKINLLTYYSYLNDGNLKPFVLKSIDDQFIVQNNNQLQIQYLNIDLLPPLVNGSYITVYNSNIFGNQNVIWSNLYPMDPIVPFVYQLSHCQYF